MRRKLLQLCSFASSAAAIGMIAPAVDAQQHDDGPVIVGERTDTLKAFTLERLNVGLDFFYQYRRNHIDRGDTGSRTDTEQIAREIMTLSSRAFIGHENLVDLSFNARLGFEDRFLKSPVSTADGHDSELLALFDISALILGDGPAPMTVWARRDQTRLSREFGSSIDSMTTEAGVSVRTFHDIAPTTFRYVHREQEQNDLADLVDSLRVQDTFSIQSVWTPTDRQRLTVDYSLDFVDENQASGIDDAFRRHDATIVHTIEFGTDHHDSLRSTLRVFDQSGDFRNRTLRLSEVLRLRHSESLDSRWDLLVEDRSIGGQDQRQARGFVTLRHNLFDSLVTTLVAGGGHVDIPDANFTSEEYFGNIDLQYTKKVPYGRLNASLAGQFERIENSERGSTLDFLATVHTFNDPFPIVINQRQIIASSIVIRDSAGVQAFSSGVDFTVMTFPDRVEIRRQVGGSIADGQTVLIDFQLRAEPGNTTESVGVSFSLRYGIEEGALRGLALYLIYREIDQAIDARRNAVITPNDVRNLRYGAEYSIGHFILLAEKETQDSDISPFELTRFTARYDYRLGRRSWLSVDASHEEIDYTDTENRVELDRVTGEWGRRLGSGFDARVRLIYRNEKDELSGSTKGFEQELEFRWQHRQTSMFISLRNSFLEGDNVDSDAQTLAIGLTRDF